MPTYDHSCLVTTVQNTSGSARFFGFLPPHGQELTSNEQLSVVGDLMEAVNRGDRHGSRHMQGLLDALDAGDLAIVSTPAPILYDETGEASKILVLDDGEFGVADPCWETSL